MQHSKQLGTESVGRLLLKFSVPAVIGMLVQALYNIVDRIYIGQGVGRLGIGATTIAFPAMTITMAFGMLVGMGATALVSIRLGEQKKEEAEKVMGNALVLLISISLFFAVAGNIFIRPILVLFGATETILPYARQYLSIILAGNVFAAIGFGMNNLIRAEGNPRMAMATMLIGGISNIILDPIFIFALKLGIQGAAIATIISQAISAAFVLRYFLFGSSGLKLHIKNIRIDTPITLKILAIGFPPFAMQLANSLQQAILNNSLRYYGGDLAIAAMGAIFSVIMLLLMPIIGINQGVQPIIGYNYGARKYDRVKKGLRLGIYVATAIALTGFAVTRIFPEQLITIFDDTDAELIEVGANGLRIFLFALPVIGFQIIGANYFQAIGKSLHATILSLSRQVILFIPLLLILPRFMDLNGIWTVAPIADVGAALLTGTYIFFEIRKLNSQHKEQDEKLVIGEGPL